jgi:hypothetical protein
VKRKSPAAQDAESLIANAPPVAAEAPREKATRAAKAAAEEAPKQRQPDFLWSGLPVFRCRLCGDQYERVNDLASVEDHERTQHPTNARVSQVLGPGGKPLIVVD